MKGGVHETGEIAMMGTSLVVDDMWPVGGIKTHAEHVLRHLSQDGMPLMSLSSFGCCRLHSISPLRPLTSTVSAFSHRELGFYSPGYHPPLGWRGPRAVTVHDLQYLRYRSSDSSLRRAYFRAVTTRLLLECNVVLTVSGESKEEIDTLLNGAVPVEVVGGGVGPDFFAAGRRFCRSAARRSAFRIISIGNWLPHKRIPELVQAARRASLRTPIELSLPPLVGRGAAIGRGLAELASDTLAIEFREHVSDATLARCIAEADLLVFLSREEGLGLPPFEAQAVGTPVLVSDFRGSRDRYGVNGAHYLDADASQAELVSMLLLLMDSPELLHSTVQSGRDNVRDMTWKRVAERVQAALVRYEVCAA